MAESIEILFSNLDFLLVYKPAEVLSVRSRMGANDPRPVLWDLLEAQLDHKVLAVHRLDFEVSGLMLWARSTKGQQVASSWFESGRVIKTYQALSSPEIAGPAQWELWTSKLLRGKKRAYESPHGQPARTEARLLQSVGGTCQWLLRPLTGRNHQLRVELAKRRSPINGDQLYGSTQTFTPGIALRAIEFDFSRIPAQQRLGLPDHFAVNKSTQLFALEA